MKNFLCVDGESIKHQYVLLGSNRGHTLINKDRITTDEALAYLIRLREANPGMPAICFGLTYDVEHWMRDLPDKNKKELFQSKIGETFYSQYHIAWTPKKIFRLTELHQPVDYQNPTVKTEIIIYDVMTFFNGGFEKAVKDVLGYSSAQLTEGKANRSKFALSSLDKMASYNKLECELLEKLMGEVANRFHKIGIVPRQWYGPSGIAQQVLTCWKTNTEIQRLDDNRLLPNFRDHLRGAYFGGRIELLKLGTFKGIHSYDINSAYPYAISIAPKCSLRWRSCEYHKSNPDFSVYKVSWNIAKGYIGPFPHRKKSGNITFPLMGTGHYWKPEIDAAIAMYGSDQIKVEGGWKPKEIEKSELSQHVKDLYAQRQELKAKGDTAEFAIKIVLNSMYGKFAQSVGYASFRNLAYAGYITSVTRAKLLRACIGQERHIIGFATDAIHSLKPLNLPESKLLGEWSHDRYKKVTFIMPGLYRMESESGEIKTGSRGHGKITDFDKLLTDLNEKGKGKAVSQYLVGYKLAQHQPHALGAKYCQIVQRPKEIKPYSLKKRVYEHKKINWKTENYDSSAYKGSKTPSYPYFGKTEDIKEFFDLTIYDD